MPKINKYEDIEQVEREARKDYIDRHSPFISVENEKVEAGSTIKVTVQVGKEYTHPDDFDHYISSISLFNRETKLAEATLFAGTLGGQDKKGNATVTFDVLVEKKMVFTAHAYCTKHGIWESFPLTVDV